jgi:hypothetical protein
MSLESLLAGGALGAIVTALWRLATDLLLESRKTELKKSEFLFQKQFEAASQFMALRRGLMPAYRFREMEWADACDDFASRFDTVEHELADYLSIHGVALPKETLDKLTNAIERASAGKFEVQGDQVSRKGSDEADVVMKRLEEIEAELRQAVWKQSKA